MCCRAYRGCFSSYHCSGSFRESMDFLPENDRLEILEHHLDCLNIEKEKTEKFIKKLKRGK